MKRKQFIQTDFIMQTYCWLTLYDREPPEYELPFTVFSHYTSDEKHKSAASQQKKEICPCESALRYGPARVCVVGVINRYIH